MSGARSEEGRAIRSRAASNEGPGSESGSLARDASVIDKIGGTTGTNSSGRATREDSVVFTGTRSDDDEALVCNASVQSGLASIEVEAAETESDANTDAAEFTAGLLSARGEDFSAPRLGRRTIGRANCRRKNKECEDGNQTRGKCVEACQNREKYLRALVLTVRVVIFGICLANHHRPLKFRVFVRRATINLTTAIVAERSG